jgi:PEP-CTERM motif
MKRKVLLATVLLSGSLCANASATPIAGNFNISGTLAFTSNSMSWFDGATPERATVAAGGTGDFSALTGTQVTIHNLTSAVEPTGAPFAAQPFISFQAAPSFPTLDIDFIFAGIYSAAQCAAAPAVGQQCTSPSLPYMNFVNNPAPAGPQATSTFVFSGVTSDGLEDWTASFTMQFNVPFQTVLSTITAGGVVSNTYSATFIVTPNDSTPVPVPEPASLLLVAAGLGRLALRKRNR